MLHLWTESNQRNLSSVLGQKAVQSCEVWPLSTYPTADPDDVVLAMGGNALRKLKTLDLVPSAATLDASRGHVWQDGGARYMTTFGPGLVQQEWDKRGIIRWDFRLARRVHETGTTEPEVGEYNFTDCLQRIIDQVESEYEKTGRAVPVSFDLETMGFWAYYPDKHIVTSQWSVAGNEAWVVNHLDHPCEGRIREQIEWLLTSPKVRLFGANLKFDLIWVAVKWGIECTNFVFDLVLGGSLVDENRSNSLGWLTKEYVPVLGGYDDNFDRKFKAPPGEKRAKGAEKSAKGYMDQHVREDPDQFLIYAGGDSDATMQVSFEVQKRLARFPRLVNFYGKLLHPAARTFEHIERRGVLCNEAGFRELEKELEEAIREATRAALELIPIQIRARYIDNLSPSRPAIMLDYLFDDPAGLKLKPKVWAGGWNTYEDAFENSKSRYKSGPNEGEPVPSTSVKDHLEQFSDHPKAGPFIAQIKEINSASKTLSTYVRGFLAHLRPDGRFHPVYALHNGSLFEERKRDDNSGTVTGRLAAKYPAVQTIPKHTKWATPLRKCYPAPKGMQWWEADFSQGELRIMACLSGDKNMQQVYLDGYDLHLSTGATLAGVEIDEFVTWKKSEEPYVGKLDDTELKKEAFKAYRQRAKAGNFGIIYKISAEGFQEFALKTYFVRMSLAECKRFIRQFFEAYPAIPEFHERQIEFAREHQYVESPLGRRRNLPLINSRDGRVRGSNERYAINSPIQSTLSDLNIWAAHLVDAEYGGADEVLSVNGATHDCCYGYVREKDWKDHLTRVCEIMGNLPIAETFGWEPEVPFPAEVDLGPTWGEMEELGNLAA